MVHEAWNHIPHVNPMKAFSHLLSHTPFNLLQWRRLGVNKIESSLLDTEACISPLEVSDFSSNSQSLLMAHYAKLVALQPQCNINWAQPAHLTWVKDGDKNTSFFHSTTCIHSLVNTISQVVDPNGNVHSNHAGIENAFLIYYKDLWTSLPARLVDIINALPRDLPHIFDADAANLIRAVTKEEVYCTIYDLPTGKSPGPDGFNVEFFRNFWSVIGDQLYSSIRFFFDHYVLSSSWGKTYIVLNPNKDKPKFILDFRPISLCNVCFKIISKILAKHLKLVLPSLIGRE